MPVDAISLEVFRNLFASVAEEMGVTLQRASFSPNIRERLDFSCAVFDKNARMVAQAAHIPVHLGSMPASVEFAIRSFEQLNQGDLIVLNDPYRGGTHLPDITMVSPVFDADGIAFYVASRAHHADVGGMSPGSLPLSTELYQEGLIIPPVLLRETEYHINPTGSFEIGGPDGDAGLTGRKIIVDTYGGAAPHGGGAFSGKDPTKVDRSAAYISRYLAKNIVAAGLATRCTIQLAYAIGVSKPLSLYVDTHETGKVGDDAIEKAIMSIGKLGGLTPRSIRTHLGLNKPIYRKTAAYGHFGRKPEGDMFPWERDDLVDDLKLALA